MEDSEYEIKSILYSNSKVSATECEAITRELIKLISERDKEWVEQVEKRIDSYFVDYKNDPHLKEVADVATQMLNYIKGELRAYLHNLLQK